MNEWSKDDETKSGNTVIKTSSKKREEKQYSITGSILETMVTKPATKMERKLYNLCKNHWT
jgi:hypothetical protein